MAGKLDRPVAFQIKRCPYCSVDMPAEARICQNCKGKVGKVDKNGRGKEPIDWKAYLMCAVSWILFIFFVWWGFLKEK